MTGNPPSPGKGAAAALIPNAFGERVPDELYARASAHYDDKALRRPPSWPGEIRH
jgi:hypothetical protein